MVAYRFFVVFGKLPVDPCAPEGQTTRWPRIFPLLFFSAAAATVIGCGKSDATVAPPNLHIWTVSGKSYLVGSTDPLAGVTVKCAGLTAISGSDGSFKLQGVPDGTQLLTAEKPDCILYSETLDVSADVTHHVFLDFQGTDLSGFITNGVDGPVMGATVRFRGFVSKTDISGLYRFVHVPQGTDTMHVLHPSYFAVDTLLSLHVSNTHTDVTLQRDSVLQITTATYTYVDESTPDSIIFPPGILYLRGNGNDSSGTYHAGVRRLIYITFDFPQIFHYPSATVLDARLELSTNAPYPPVTFQTFALTSAWTILITYNRQPTIGQLLYSGTAGDVATAKYTTMLGTDGFNKLVTVYRTTGRFQGVVIQRGGYYPIAFYTIGSHVTSPPRVTIKLRY